MGGCGTKHNAENQQRTKGILNVYIQDQCSENTTPFLQLQIELPLTKKDERGTGCCSMLLHPTPTNQ